MTTTGIVDWIGKGRQGSWGLESWVLGPGSWVLDVSERARTTINDGCEWWKMCCAMICL